MPGQDPNFETLKTSFEGNICEIRIDRPQALNALNSQVLSDLSNCFEQLKTKSPSELRCVILTGSGEKAFVAGADIREMQGLTSDQALAFGKKGQKVFRQIEQLQVPVIAAVNGFALGGGLELAMACDFIYAADSAKLGLPEVTLGLIPGFGGTVRLSRYVGLQRARELVMSGNMIPASEAQRLGLVSQVFPVAELLSAVQKIAKTISDRSPTAVSSAKKSMMAAFDLDIDAAMEFEAKSFSGLFNSADVTEGTTAFVEKRKPVFTGAMK